MLSLLVGLAATFAWSCGGESNPTTPSAPSQTKIIGLSGTLAFGDVTVGQKATAALTIANSGTAPLNVSGIAFSTGLGDVFTLSVTSATIAPGGSQSVTVQFAPTSAAVYSGLLTVSGDQTGGTNTIPVAGTGTKSALPAAYCVSGTILDGTSRGVLPKVLIQVTAGAGAANSTLTDGAGNYSVCGLTAGAYSVSASATSYDTGTQQVTLSGNTRLDWVLQRSTSGPNVTVSFDGPSGCTPLPTKPCTLQVVAQASNPDGGALRYAWSGCATGTSSRATCTIDRPGQATASVEVSDGHGHTTGARAYGDGQNQPPSARIGYLKIYPSGMIDLLGYITDPDEGFLCGREHCSSATGSGACSGNFIDCTCLADLEVILTRKSDTGTCTVAITVKDSWGLPGTSTFSFDVTRAPGPLYTAGPGGAPVDRQR